MKQLYSGNTKKRTASFFSVAGRRFLGLLLTVFSMTAYSQSTYTFMYTGAAQTLALQPGTFDIKAWGGDGYTQTAGYNGKGGYANGILTLTSASTIHIYVGGLGSYPSGGVNANTWTFNGGGIGYPASNSNYGNGGGASDVRTVGGTWDNATSLASRVIVAGGGGAGRNSSYIGGNGGGLTGGTGTYFSPDQTGGPTGGTQTSGGSNTGYTSGLTQATLGKAMTWDGNSLTASFLAGGGGGYYGGASGRVAGGGGSSYIGGVSSGTTIMNGQTGFVANPDATGNGRVIITELCSIGIMHSSGTVTPAQLCAGSSLTLTTDAVSNYSWSTGATSSSIVVSPTSNTMITVTATSSMNCTATGVLNIIVSSGPPVLSVSNPSNNICLGKTVSLTATGAITYTWANAGVVNGQTFTPNSTAVYTVSGQNGCGITTATTTITVAPLQVNTLASPALVCQGYTSTLTAVSAVSNYTWEPGSITGNTAVVAPLANTIYTVSASDGTCFGTQTVAVNTQPTPTISVSVPFISLCEGQVATLSATGADSYTWNPGNLSGSSATVSPNTSSLYVVTGEYTNGCSSSNQIAVVVVNAPTLSINASKTTVCSGATVALTASGGDAYQWINGPASAGFTVTPTVSSTYTVTGTHSTNSCVATKTIDITAIVPNVTFPTNTMVCVGGSVMLTASGANTYVWGSQSTGTVNTFVMQPTGTTTLTITANTTSGSVVCPETQTVEVTVNPLPTLSVTAQRATMCRFETNTLTVTGAQTYDWGTLGTTNTVVITPTTTLAFYAVTGTDANGCVKSFTYQAKVNTCSGIEELEAGNGQITVYPNPNTGLFTVSTRHDITLSLTNELGQVVRSFKINEGENATIDVRDISNGIYFLMGESDRGTVKQKIIITK